MNRSATLVIYDSAYGNTEKVARMIAGQLDGRLLLVKNVQPDILAGIELLVVGSPTQGGRPTQAIQDFLHSLLDGSLRGKTVAAFDTRFAINDHGFGLRLLMKTIGFAAEKIAAGLQAKGGRPAGDPAGFIVADKEGPLQAGELDRAGQWADNLRSTVTAAP